MEFILNSNKDKPGLMGRLAALEVTEPLKVTIKEADRTSQQNRLLHARLSDVSRQVKHYDQSFTVEVWKRLCTASWLREQGEQCAMIPALDGNGFDLVHMRTSKMTVKQLASLVAWIEAYGSEHNVKWTAADHWNGRY